MITGGLSGLGLRVAQWVVEQGGRHLVLMGRSAPSCAAREMIERLERAGAHVAVKQGDVSNRDDVARVLDEIERSFPPLRGVFHSAAVLDDGVLIAAELGPFCASARTQDAGGVALAQLDAAVAARLLRDVLLDGVGPGLGGPIELRGGQRVSRCTGTPPAGPGASGLEHQLGALVRNRRRRRPEPRRPAHDRRHRQHSG